MGTACSVILLTQPNSNPYVVTQIMPVTSNKIIIGHPIDIPVIKSVKGVERLFDGERRDATDGSFVVYGFHRTRSALPGPRPIG